MATATQDAPAGTVDSYTNGFMPDFFQRWEDEKAERATARAMKRPAMLECLDPEVAADYEAKKPRFQFEVDCTYKLPKDDGSGLETKHERQTITAHSESDAWAIFCDRIKHWPSRHAVDVTITKVAKGR